MHKPFSWDAFEQMPIIGIMRNIPAERVEKLVALYHAAGFGTLEVTLNSANAIQTIADLVKNYGGELNIGAGTVLSVKELYEAIDAGASFIVTPVIDEEVITASVLKGIPIFPGAYTPSEIYRAWSLGASMVKVFPATRLGAEYIKEVLAPLNHLKLVPTGGVSADNFTEFLKAGAKGLGMGSTLFPAKQIANEQWTEIAELFSGLVTKYRQFMSKSAT